MSRLARHEFLFRPHPPYEIDTFLRRMGRGPFPHTYIDHVWRRLVYVGDRYIPVKVDVGIDRWHPELRICIYCESYTLVREAYEATKKIFMVDLNYGEFIRDLKEYPSIYELAVRHAGERPLGHHLRYEAFVEAILLNSSRFTPDYDVLRRFIEKFGVHMEVEGEEYWGFPRPEELAALKREDLGGILGTRVKYWALVGLGKKSMTGEEGEREVFGVGGVTEGYVKSRMENMECTERDIARLIRYKSKALLIGVSRDDYNSIFLALRKYCGLILHLVESEYSGNP